MRPEVRSNPRVNAAIDLSMSGEGSAVFARMPLARRQILSPLPTLIGPDACAIAICCCCFLLVHTIEMLNNVLFQLVDWLHWKKAIAISLG